MKKTFIFSGILFYFLAAFPVQAYTPTIYEIMDNTGLNTYADSVFGYDSNQNAYANYGSAAKNTASGDVFLPDDHTELFIGSDYVFDKVMFDINQAGETSGPLTGGKDYILKYWDDNKNDWLILDYNDQTSNFENTGYKAISFDIPERWDDSVYSKKTVNGEKRFWLKLAADNNVTVNSAARVSQIALLAYNFMLFAESETGENLDENLLESAFSLSDGGNNIIEGFRDIGGDYYELALDNNFPDSKYSLTVSPTKYVSATIATDDLSSINGKEAETMDFQYSHVVQVKKPGGSFIVPDLVVVGGVTCEIGAVFAYCPLTTAEDGGAYPADVTVYKSGYANKTVELSGQRSFASDKQIVTVVTMGQGSSAGLLPAAYSYIHIKLLNEDNNPIQNLDEDNFKVSEGSDNEIYGFTNNSNGDYVLTLNGAAADTSYTVKVFKDGYEPVSFDTNELNSATVYKTLKMNFSEKNSEECSSPFDDLNRHWAELEIEELYCRGVVSGRDYDTFAPDSSITRAEFLKVALLNAGYGIGGHSGENFSDVNPEDWYYEYVSLAVDRGFITGYSDGTYRPNEAINRAEALVILLRIAGQTLYDFDSSDIDFGDVSVADWFAYAIVIADHDNIVNGYGDGTFRPENKVSRGEVAVMAERVYKAYYSGR